MTRGAKPGERRGGRTKGTPNKVTTEIKELARVYGPAAIKEAAKLAGLIDGETCAESEAVKATCLSMVLDRAYGKPSQTIGSDPDNPLPDMPRVIEHIYVDPKDKS